MALNPNRERLRAIATLLLVVHIRIEVATSDRSHHLDREPQSADRLTSLSPSLVLVRLLDAPLSSIIPRHKLTRLLVGPHIRFSSEYSVQIWKPSPPCSKVAMAP